jgi:hypothetical protein
MMTWTVISESDFDARVNEFLQNSTLNFDDFGFVTGPGRSGAIAAVYVSHKLALPFIPFNTLPRIKGRALIVDTARESGETMKKALRRYARYFPAPIIFYEEPPRVAFWYEAGKPQRYRHENTRITGFDFGAAISEETQRALNAIDESQRRAWSMAHLLTCD